MKFEIDIPDSELADRVKQISRQAAGEMFKDRYSLTSHGEAVARTAQRIVADAISSGEVADMVKAAARGALAKVVSELTLAEIRKAVRAELKAMRERGQLELTGEAKP